MKNKKINIIYILLVIISFIGIFIFSFDYLVKKEICESPNYYLIMKDTYTSNNYTESFKKYVSKILKNEDSSFTYETCILDEECNKRINSETFLTYYYTYINYKDDLSFLISIFIFIFIGLSIGLILLICKKYIIGIALCINYLIIVFLEIFNSNNILSYIVLIPVIILLFEFILDLILKNKKA